MLLGRNEVHNAVTIVCQELHQQLVKGQRKLCILILDIRSAEFVGMHLNIRELLKNISVSLNGQGSAKAMEPDMFVEMVKDITKKGIEIAKVAGDDDHTGINRVRKLRKF